MAGVTAFRESIERLAETARLQEARRYFLKAIEIDPHNVSARQSLTMLDNLESLFGIDAGRR